MTFSLPPPPPRHTTSTQVRPAPTIEEFRRQAARALRSCEVHDEHVEALRVMIDTTVKAKSDKLKLPP